MARQCLHIFLLMSVLICLSCSDDPSSESSKDTGRDTRVVQDSSTGDGDVGADAGKDVAVPVAFDTFDPRTCRLQTDGSVTLYAEHTDPSGCVLLTFEESSANDAFDVDVNEGWRIRAASVTDAPGCPTAVPGDHTDYVAVDSAEGQFQLVFTDDGFPMGVQTAALTVGVGEQVGNPFGYAELLVDDQDATVFVCPGTVDN